MDVAKKRALLEVAREAVRVAALEGRAPAPRPPVASVPSDLGHSGVFVTLHGVDGDLRGCVGTTASSPSVVEAVREMACAAALRDPRFAPVRPDEVNDLQIEISLLTALEQFASLPDLRVGRHGLMVEGRGRRGLLLPQVASEQGWDATVFVEQTCRKAGLEQDAYLDDDVALFRFETVILSEKDLGKA